MGNYWLDEIEKEETHCVMADVQMRSLPDFLQELLNKAAHLGHSATPMTPEFLALLNRLAEEEQ